MPSGITHILLTKNLQSNISNNLRLRSLLGAGKYFLQVGAVGPDLPYASILDSDITNSETELADTFHYNDTSKIPRLALREIKNRKDDFSLKQLDALFCFFAGYISHIVADGVIHPFVRDVVGNYDENKTDHRILEMRLDVLFNNYLTSRSGDQTEFNYTNMHDELTNIFDYEETQTVMELFSSVIEDAYGISYEAEKILDWVHGLHNLLGLAEGSHATFYRTLSIFDGLLYSDFSDLEERREEIFTLNVVKDNRPNFLRNESIHFINDCVPQFYKKFVPILSKAYQYIYDTGDELTEEDLPNINLDTGRPLPFGNNLDLIPTYWS